MGVVVFDLDGTLIDSVGDLTTALNALLQSEHREPVGLAQARLMIGGGARQLLTLAWAATGPPADEAAVERLYPLFVKIYRENLLGSTRLFPGALSALDALHRHRLAVCTNKPIDPTERILVGLGLRHRFTAVFGGDSVPLKKPDPAMLLAAVAACGGGSAVMVGDSHADFEAARNAGIPCVGVRWGYPGPHVGQVGPDRWIERYDELPAIVESLLSGG